jgi:hypothetical protein
MWKDGTGRTGRSSDISVSINEWGLLLTFLISFSWLRLLPSAGFTTRIWGVSETGYQGNEYIGTECSSWVRKGGRGVSQKGMGACRFPTTTEITELRPLFIYLRVPLSHSCAKTLDPDLVSRSNAPIFTRIRIRYDHMMHNIFDLFLDFKEKIPHSSSQINPYDD